ncbi:MAG: hypothetical protein HYU64_12715 [Armatimonadetes bacterium]|nr:hypothetical protein [Armatimonadota bacterium]
MKLIFFLFLLSAFAVSAMAIEQFPEISIKVTGKKVSGEFLRECIGEEILALSRRYPGFTAGLDIPLPSLNAGESLNLPISAGYRGEDAMKEVSLLFRVKHERFLPPETTFHLFSDHPEMLSGDGRLLSAGLIFGRPVTLQYYHGNRKDSSASRTIYLQVHNPGPKPAALQIIKARAGPSPYEMKVGHQLNVSFLRRFADNQGVIIEIPAGSDRIVATHEIPPGQVASGLILMHLIRGSPQDLTLFVRSDGETTPPASVLSDEKDMHARGIYDIPTIRRTIPFRGIQELTIPIGDRPLRNLFPGQPLKGDYGVLYDLVLLLHNPRPRPLRLDFLFCPRGGAATGTFLFGDELVELGVVKAYQVARIGHMELPPGGKTQLRIRTIPEGGSSYPVWLIVRGEIVNSEPTGDTR